MIIDEDSAEQISDLINEIDYESGCIKDEMEIIEDKITKLKILLEM